MKPRLTDVLELELEQSRQRVSQLEQQLLALNSTDQAIPPTAQLDNELRPLFDSSEDLIIFVDLEGSIVFANQATVVLLKAAEGLHVHAGLDVIKLFPADQIDFISHSFRLVKRGKTLRTNYTGANQREYAAIIQPVRDEQSIVGIAIFARDITKAHEMQQRLRRYEQIVASSPNLIALVDCNHQLQLVNDAFLQAFNKKRQFIIGSHINQLEATDSYSELTLPALEQAFLGRHIQLERWIDTPGIGRRFFSISYRPLRSQDLQPKFVVMTARDMTDLKRAETDRQRVFELSLDMLSISTMEGQFIETNPAWKRILGWSKEELRNKAWLELVVTEDLDSSTDVAARLNRGEIVVGFENRCRCKDGSVKWLAWSSYPDPEKKRIFSTVRDTTARKRMEEELLQLATTDPLTGASNRRYFIDCATSELARVRRYGSHMAVLMLDIDYFKEVNDTYGHSVGDEALKRLVDCCHQELRETDIFGRYGGEEFAAVLVNTDKAGALNICKRLLLKIAQLKIRAGSATVKITVSLGMTMHQADDSGIDALLKRADDALYQAKNQGRNQLVLS
ncbi:diguanylate cyclase [Pelovirga terrestris]|uniref:Diguanylate cyclase n=1 Tax=Pelovirga terrestris TaxID=2771352 RepID=A0A8J6QWW2_9BACT|nr:diguanylate cyclase [Pelovirga terrestris]MBD1400278.1 diguanylate cyclase [Pelovirga terrestris]